MDFDVEPAAGVFRGGVLAEEGPTDGRWRNGESVEPDCEEEATSLEAYDDTFRVLDGETACVAEGLDFVLGPVPFDELGPAAAGSGTMMFSALCISPCPARPRVLGSCVERLAQR